MFRFYEKSHGSILYAKGISVTEICPHSIAFSALSTIGWRRKLLVWRPIVNWDGCGRKLDYWTMIEMSGKQVGGCTMGGGDGGIPDGTLRLS